MHSSPEEHMHIPGQSYIKNFQLFTVKRLGLCFFDFIASRTRPAKTPQFSLTSRSGRGNVRKAVSSFSLFCSSSEPVAHSRHCFTFHEHGSKFASAAKNIPLFSASPACNTTYTMESHIRIHPQCGACGFTFADSEAIVARKMARLLYCPPYTLIFVPYSS
jgi:hypothetical protein